MIPFLFKSLSNGPCKKEGKHMPQGMQKGANFCTTLLFYHTSDWLNQQKYLPRLQVAVYLFIFN